VNVPAFCPGTLFPILVFAYFEGAPLSARYRDAAYAEGFAVDEFLPLAISLSTIVAGIHAQQFIHRDLTSANILYASGSSFGGSGSASTVNVRVIDFGISTPFPTQYNAAANVSKTLQGTIQFLSPEQTGRIGRIVDYRTDIYSLGTSAQHTCRHDARKKSISISNVHHNSRLSV
jgi:serine/threonine protein kinase